MQQKQVQFLSYFRKEISCMKKWFMILFTGIAGTAFSQQPGLVNKDTVFRRGPYTIKGSASGSSKDTILPKLWEQLQDGAVPNNGMPNAFTTKPAPDVYEGNNGKGQDIYRSQLDNMAILKPDSTFYSSMRPARVYSNKKGGIYKGPYTPGVPHIRVLPKQPKYAPPKRK